MAIKWQAIWPWANRTGLRRTDSPAHKLLEVLVHNPPIGGMVDITAYPGSNPSQIQAFGRLIINLEEGGHLRVYVTHRDGTGFVGETKNRALEGLLGGATWVQTGAEPPNDRKMLETGIQNVRIVVQLLDKGQLLYFQNIAEDRRDILDRFVPFIAVLTFVSTVASFGSLVVSLVPRAQEIEIINWPASTDTLLNHAHPLSAPERTETPLSVASTSNGDTITVIEGSDSTLLDSSDRALPLLPPTQSAADRSTSGNRLGKP